MYKRQNEFFALSEDFVHWECTPCCASEYSGSLNEVCTAVTDYQVPGKDDIVLFVAGNMDRLCPERNLFYAITECLMSRENPMEQVDRLTVPIIQAEYPYEKSLERLSGEAARGTIFLDSVFASSGKWYAYYGASDSNIGVATCSVKNAASCCPDPYQSLSAPGEPPLSVPRLGGRIGNTDEH